MHPPLVEIVLEKNVVEFRGSDTECAGTVVRGSLIINFADSIKVKHLDLYFEGVTKLYWNTGNNTSAQKSVNEKKRLAFHHWSYISNKKGTTLTGGPHVYDFELTLPGDLPPSIKTEFGKIKYKFKAKLDRPVFIVNKNVSVELIVKRYPQQSSPILSEPFIIEDVYKNIFNYEISSPNQAIGEGKEIPLLFKFMFIDPCYKPKQIDVILKEYLEYRSPSKKDTKNDSKIIDRISKQLIGYQDYSLFETKIIINEKKNKHMLSDCSTSMISVSHKIKFNIVIQHKTSSNNILQCSFKSKIIIFPRSVDDIVNELPRYESYHKNQIPLGNPFASNNSFLQPIRQNENLPSYKSADKWSPPAF